MPKGFSALVLALVLAVAAASCGGSAGAPSPSPKPPEITTPSPEGYPPTVAPDPLADLEGTEYRHTDPAYRFHYAEGWTVVPSTTDDAEVIAFADPPDLATSPGWMTIGVMQAPDGFALGPYAKLMANSLNSTQKVSVVALNTDSFASNRAVRIVYDVNHGGETYRVMQMFTFIDETIYSATYSAPTDSWKKHFLDAGLIARSFTVDQPDGTWKGSIPTDTANGGVEVNFPLPVLPN